MQHKPPRQAKSGSQRSHEDMAVWRNLLIGTFHASQSEPRISGDISQWCQWTGRYSIALGRSRAPSASLDLPPAISTRSSLSSHCRSTRTQKVHAFPLTRKRLSFPLLRKSLSVFLGPGFSWVSNMCNGISPWIFSYSNAAATIQVLHCRLLAYFASIKFARTC